MPKGIGMLVKSITKTIPEESIDDILSGIKDFCANVYIHIERIQGESLEIEGAETREDLISNDPEIQIVVKAA